MGNGGKHEFIQILRLMEAARLATVAAAVADAIRRGVIGFDAVKQLVIARVEGRPPRLDPTTYPYRSIGTGSACSWTEPKAAPCPAQDEFF